MTKMDRPPDTRFFIKTPLLYSTQMSALAGANVWLKMENMQIAGSFKSRGLSNMARKVNSFNVDATLPSTTQYRQLKEVAPSLYAIQVPSISFF